MRNIAKCADEITKLAFNKENPIDLFSQLVKVLYQRNISEEKISRLKQLSREIFTEVI